MILTIADEDGNEIFQKKYALKTIPTGEFYTYKIGKRIDEEKRYAINIKYDGMPNAEEDIPVVMISESRRNLPGTQEALVNGEYLAYDVAGEMVSFNVAINYRYQQKKWFRL